jgi:tetratricopeptide (TPR) repeat protein
MIPNKRNALFFLTTLLLISVFFQSCSSPEEKKLKYFNKGKALYEKKDATMARIEFKNAIQIDPSFAEAYYYLAMVELMSKNYRDTVIILTKAVELNPQLWDAQLLLGRLYLAAQLYDKSMEKARLVLASQKDHTGAALLEAAVFMARNNTVQASTIINNLETKNCTAPEFFILKATIIGRNGKIAQAEDILKKGIAANPDSITLRAMLAQIYVSGNRNEEVIPLLETMIKIEPDVVAHCFALSDAYIKLGKTNESEATILSILKGKDDKEIVYIQIAQYYLNHNRVEDAKKILLTGKEKIEKCYDINLALSAILVSENKKDEAITLLNDNLSFDKSPSAKGILKTKNALATLYITMNQIDMAKKYVDEVIKESPGDLDGLYTKGLIGILSNNPNDAVSSFRTILSQSPENEKAYSLLSKAYVMNHENLALEVLKEGLAAMPNSDRLKKDLADYDLTNKKYNDAEKIYKQLIVAHPGNTDLLLNLAALYELTGQKDKAIETYRLIKKYYPSDPAGYIKTAELHIRNGNLDLAAQELETARKQTPPTAELISLLAKIYSTQKNYTKAMGLCDQQIQNNRGSEIFLNLKGSILEAAGKRDDAVNAYEKALAVKTQWDLPVQNLARIYMGEGHSDLAEKVLLESINKNSGNSSSAILLGGIYESKGKVQKAIDLYKAILGKQPENHVVANNLAVLIGETSSSSDDLKKAIGISEATVKARPSDPLMKDTLGWLYYRVGDYEKALTALTQALENAPDKPELNYHMGMILYKKDQMTQAKKHLEKAVNTKASYHGIEEARTVLGNIKG